VIKIESTSSLPVAKLGNSDSMQVGDWVLASASPFGLQADGHRGIVSAKGRNIVPGRQFQTFIRLMQPSIQGIPVTLVNMGGRSNWNQHSYFTDTMALCRRRVCFASATIRDVYNAIVFNPDHRVAVLFDWYYVTRRKIRPFPAYMASWWSDRSNVVAAVRLPGWA